MFERKTLFPFQASPFIIYELKKPIASRRIQSTFNIFHAYENDKGRRIYVTEVVADFVQFLDPKISRAGESASTRLSATATESLCRLHEDSKSKC